MLEINHLYRQQNQSLSACEDNQVDLAGRSKLSLFKAKTDSIEIEKEKSSVADLLLILKETVYFCVRESNDIICWEIYAVESEIQQFLQQKIRGSDFDFLLWPIGDFAPPKLLVFDMDSTFIQIEVIDELARQHGVGESVSKVTEAAMRGELDFSESLISRVACLKGLEQSIIAKIANNLPLSIGVEQLVKCCHQNNTKVAIVSGGFTPFVQFLKTKMGLYEVKANNLEIMDGALSGKVQGDIVDAQSKADFVNHLKSQLNIDANEIITIGDGANDLLMMKESGFNLAYRAKPAVQEQAFGRMNQTNLGDLVTIFDWPEINTK